MRVFVFLCATLISLAAQPSDDPQTWYNRGRQYSDLSRQAFEQLLKIAPESAYVLALLGEVKTKDRQYTAALYAYNEAIKRMPRLRGVRSGIADVYVALGKPEQAGAAETAEQQLGLPNCAIEKLYCDFKALRFEDVVKATKQKMTPETLFWLARAYNELAIQAFSQLAALPDSPQLHAVRAQLMRDQGQFRESADEWRTVLKFLPADVQVRHELATALYLSRDYKTALPELQQFLQAEPNSANLNFFVGDSLLQSEQVEQALPYLEKAVKLDPRLRPAHASLGLCYARLAAPAKAIPHLKATLDLDHDGSLHYQLGRAYQATGQPVLAKAMFAKYQQMKKPAAANAPAP